MTDYDFIDPDLPEENSDEKTDMNDIPKSEDKIAVENIVAEMEEMEDEVLGEEEPDETTDIDTHQSNSPSDNSDKVAEGSNGSFFSKMLDKLGL